MSEEITSIIKMTANSEFEKKSIVSQYKNINMTIMQSYISRVAKYEDEENTQRVSKKKKKIRVTNLICKVVTIKWPYQLEKDGETQEILINKKNKLGTKTM